MTTKKGTRMDLHPLAIEHPCTTNFHEGTYQELISGWLRSIEADGSRVVVLPPDAERRVYDASAVLAALGVEQDDEACD